MLHRRDMMMRLGQFGAGALTLPNLLRAQRAQAEGTVAKAGTGTAKACILVYLWGGPPQQDIWDMKPEAPSGVRSHFHPISTVVPGIDVCHEMPLFAKYTDRTAIIRSLSHDSNNHEPSVYRTLTGRINNTLAVPRNQRNRRDFPNIGSIVSSYSPLGPLPASVTIPRPIGHSGVTYSGTYAGFLGSRFDPMEIAAAADTKEKPTHSMSLQKEVNDARLVSRQGLLKVIEDHDRRYQAEKSATGLDSFREQAFGMLSSPVAKQAFNLELEKPTTRDKYGRNEYGESFLLARRLVQSGVKLVTISWMRIGQGGKVANVWDNHGPYEGKNGTEMLQQQYCLPSLDRGFAALMDDLSDTGLLDETLIAMWGEFGRTPKLNPYQGRDHWGACQSAVLAGGGIRGGQVYGSSDRDAAYPKTNPVSPEDMLATVYHALGIPPDALMRDQLNRPHHLVEGTPLAALFG